MKFRFFTRAVSTLLICTWISTIACGETGKLCAHPRPGSVPLAFSIPNFSPGEFDLVCVDRIQRAIARGFTVVTITPKIAFDRNKGTSLVGATLISGELSRCLENAWQAGLDVIYSPHAEDGTPGQAPIWRAKFELHPDEAYELAGFEEFLTWLKTHNTDIAAGPQKVRISVATELENSTLNYTDEWIRFTTLIHQRLAVLGIAEKVALGIQPNWYPVGDPDFANCDSFRKWIGMLDFISPSMYGDWSAFASGTAQVSQRVATVASALIRENHSWCEIPEFSSKPFGFGELGIGADLIHTERTDPIAPAAIPEFTRQRRQIFANVLTWMKTQSDSTLGSPIVNIWAYGFYDPTGLDQDPTVIADPQIVQNIKDYQAWRCSGAQP